MLYSESRVIPGEKQPKLMAPVDDIAAAETMVVVVVVVDTNEPIFAFVDDSFTSVLVSIATW